jgi:hypothetical protein
MDPVLLTVAIVALLAATGFAAWAWRLLRLERERSAARVAALSTAIDATTPAAPTAGISELFAAKRSDAAAGNPMLKAGVAVAMTILLAAIVAWANGRPSGAASGQAAAAGVTRTRTVAPLELLSMRHTREGTTLTVSGLVRNPPAGATVSHITAVVLAFNGAGAFVASGRAALDFTTLDPSDESPFVVTIAGAPDVARYRVSFRTEDGVVRHIDRRAEQTRLAAALHEP